MTGFKGIGGIGGFGIYDGGGGVGLGAGGMLDVCAMGRGGIEVRGFDAGLGGITSFSARDVPRRAKNQVIPATNTMRKIIMRSVIGITLFST